MEQTKTGLTIDEMITSLTLAKQQVGGGIIPLVDWSVGAGDSWPVLHISHGRIDDDSYCGLSIGLIEIDEEGEEGEGDADLVAIGTALVAAGAKLLKEVGETPPVKKELFPADLELMFDGSETSIPITLAGDIGNDDGAPAWLQERQLVGENVVYAGWWEGPKAFLLIEVDGVFQQGGVNVKVLLRELPPDYAFEQAMATATAKLQDAGLWPKSEEND